MNRVLAALFLLACKKDQASVENLPAAECMTPDRARVVVMTSPEGYLEPCGCTSNPLGGVAKLAAFWAEQKHCQKDPVLVTAGNFLFDSARLAGPNQEQEESKARLLSDVYLQMGVLAQAPGPFDRAFMDKVKAPWLRAGEVRRAESAGLKLAFVGVDESIAQAPPIAADVVIGLSALPWGKATAVKGFDVVVTAGSSELHSPATLGRTLFIDAGTQGQYAGLLELFQGAPADSWRYFDAGAAELLQSRRQLTMLEREISGLDTASKQRPLLLSRRDGLGKRITELETQPPPPPAQKYVRYSLLPLEKKLPDAAEVKKQIAGYNAKLCEWSKRSTENLNCPELAAGTAGYVGSDVCANCHAAAFKQWQTQKHAHAVKTLEDAGKFCDLSCIGCHTTGFNKAGGFCSPQKVGVLKEVSCEMCHGAGSLHVQTRAPMMRSPTEATCLQCHTKEHSDQFEFQTYRARIIGPGHGRQ